MATSGEPKARNKVHLGYILQPEMDRFYLGRGDGSDNDVKYANASMDEVEYWHLNRDDLIAFDYILRGNRSFYEYILKQKHMLDQSIYSYQLEAMQCSIFQCSK